MTYSYTYDSVGNITAISENGVLRYSYSYDKLGQLTLATHYSDEYYSSGYEDVYEYVYDKSGNILYAAHHYGVALSNTQSVAYTYGNSTWGDLLTSYGGAAISYDAMGNPLNWRNATSVTWSGRQLASLVKGGTTLSFTYNANGIRTAKNYAGVVTNYIIDGTTILAEEKAGAWRYYYYDESGTVAGINFNGAMYLYRKNLQGDITGIYNANGVLVVEYTYGPYGEVLSVTGSMANTLGRINPFRYRGYYYDTETGFYYLQFRYYDPVVGRFLNADVIIGANGGILGYNSFAYCSNNPVMMIDHSGYCPANSIGPCPGEDRCAYYELRNTNFDYYFPEGGVIKGFSTTTYQVTTHYSDVTYIPPSAVMDYYLNEFNEDDSLLKKIINFSISGLDTKFGTRITAAILLYDEFVSLLFSIKKSEDEKNIIAAMKHGNGIVVYNSPKLSGDPRIINIDITFYFEWTGTFGKYPYACSPYKRQID